MTLTKLTPTENLAKLIRSLCQSACFPHPVGQIEVMETHISYVLLAGDFAYKIKKPVNFGFLDFSSLAKRKFYCEEELRLNKRHASDLYLEVVPIGGSAGKPILNAKKGVIEYAVKMRRFSQQHLLDKLIQSGQISGEQIDQLAQGIVDFHQNVAIASADCDYGSLAQIHKYTLENVQIIAPLLTEKEDIARMSYYEGWLTEQHQKLAPLMQARQQQGFIRECHGDLHLRNILFSEGEFYFFDCIEFNPALRWVDVISELAFLAMDLEAAGRADLSHRLINAYFEISGDYDGLPLLRYYLAYRAMVRAKVAFLRLPQAVSVEEKAQLRQSGSDYLQLAWRYAVTPEPELTITHGFSGSGKSVHTLCLLEKSGAIRIRSDFERKRMRGIAAAEASAMELADKDYNAQVTQQTYERLRTLAEVIINAGFSAIVDATFLKHWQRALFLQLAEKHQIKFSILHYHASLSELKRRIVFRQQRRNDVSDASLAVLEMQLKTAEALTDAERA
ncbi:MAG TPA: AAA family ATPase, partial [Pseudomonadales bacterium]|nr:AAA family ATPase [Pseudomonadales bacterium]